MYTLELRKIIICVDDTPYWTKARGTQILTIYYLFWIYNLNCSQTLIQPSFKKYASPILSSNKIVISQKMSGKIIKFN